MNMSAQRITEIGAVCEIEYPLNSYRLREYVKLENGQRVFWRFDRGWSGSGKPEEIGPGCFIVRQAMYNLESDEVTSTSYFELIVVKLKELGLDFDVRTLYEAPFRIEFSPKLRNLLREASSQIVQ